MAVMGDKDRVFNMQCKDISDAPILEWLVKHTSEHKWANWFGDEYENSVTHSMPKGIPGKLVLAKMGMLVRRGFVEGCTCGCRGDFYITEKGKEYLITLTSED